MKHLVFAFCLLTLSLPAGAQSQASPPSEPTERPNWADARARGETQLKSTLFDPSSAEIEYVSGFQWGILKPIIGRRKYGWVACGLINAKNRMGGYVGSQPFFILIDANGEVYSSLRTGYVSVCELSPAVPVQAELQKSQLPSDAPSTTLSVADELAKLAELKEKGIITQSEFDVQKAKLLSGGR